MLRNISLAILLAAAAFSSGACSTTTGSEHVACADLVNMTTSVELLEAPCTLPNGYDFYGGVKTAECTRGTMLWNLNGWGYVGKPLHRIRSWPGNVASTRTEPSGFDAAGCHGDGMHLL